MRQNILERLILDIMPTKRWNRGKLLSLYPATPNLASYDQEDISVYDVRL
jgi:hypothetical protein